MKTNCMKPQTISTEPESPAEIHKDELITIVRGTGITFIGKFLESGLKFLYIIVIARLLGAESFGLFALGITVIGIAGLFSRLGLDYGVVKHVSLYNGINDKKRVKGNRSVMGGKGWIMTSQT
jgi:O-antigen/teichoic acid export membrane protein